jgi:Tol biopolymer transport system component
MNVQGEGLLKLGSGRLAKGFALVGLWVAVWLGMTLANSGFQDLTSLDWAPIQNLHLLFCQGGQVFLWQKDGSSPPSALTPEGIRVTWARFSPDGEWFAYVTPWEEQYVLWRGWLDGREPEELYRSPVPIHQPEVMPDGQSVVLVEETDGQTDLVLVNLETKEVRPLTHTPFQEACPDVSPSGDLLCFVALWPGETTESWELFIMDLRTGAIQQLTEDPFFDWCPRFSPDGEWIAFESGRSGLTDIYVIRKDGTDLTPFTYDEWRDAFPAWSPGGEELAYAKRRPEGWVIFTEGTY